MKSESDPLLRSSAVSEGLGAYQGRSHWESCDDVLLSRLRHVGLFESIREGSAGSLVHYVIAAVDIKRLAGNEIGRVVSEKGGGDADIIDANARGDARAAGAF